MVTITQLEDVKTARPVKLQTRWAVVIATIRQNVGRVSCVTPTLTIVYDHLEVRRNKENVVTLDM